MSPLRYMDIELRPPYQLSYPDFRTSCVTESCLLQNPERNCGLNAPIRIVRACFRVPGHTDIGTRALREL